MSISNIGSSGAQPGSLILGSPGQATVIEATPDGFYVVSFTEVNPPLRNDGNAWTSVRISESAALAGPWTLIDTQPLTPADADPSQPAERDFTTALATSAEGFYSLVFYDAQGASSHPLVQIQDVPSEIQPSISDLGSFMRARTVAAGSGGSELGTFTNTTRPTAAEAQMLLEQATNYVLMQTGAEIPDRFIIQTRYAVILHAAMLVELTFYRNEVSRDQSAYAQYEQLFKDTMTALKMAIAGETPASPQAAFWSVPIMNDRQAHWQRMFAAMDPASGNIDPSKLGVEEFYPLGYGGIPPAILANWPWLFGQYWSDSGLAFLED